MDALLTALYVHLDDHVMPSQGRPRGRGRPPVLTPAEAVVVAVAQVLLRCDDERRWMRMAAGRIGHLFPRLPSQSQYNRQLRALGPAMSAAALWLARQVPTWHEPLRLMDGTAPADNYIRPGHDSARALLGVRERRPPGRRKRVRQDDPLCSFAWPI
ncbi:hypothetical protein GCM10009850_117380 [Nonomuraea monospora]|uniref:Transposase n=1 Tax=Nonomuraea monospora TaxID=568818 RepID=A0ABN3D3A5_9ACTN